MLKTIYLAAITIISLSILSFGGEKLEIARPVEIDTMFKNPGMGWLTYNYMPYSNPYVFHRTPLSSAVYCNYFTWRDLETNYEGDYRWDLIDNFVDYWSQPSLNKKINIGIHLTDPHCIPGAVHIPQWVFEDSRMSGRWYDNWYGNKCEKKFEPEYWNPFFLEKLGKFLKAFGDRYYKTPKWQQFIERIDISTYGYWGEWHSEIKWPDEETKIKTLRTMIDQYVQAFPRDRVPTPVLAKDIAGWGGEKDLRDHGVYYAVEQLGAMMVRRSMGWLEAFPPHERQFLIDHYKKSKFHGEWGSIDGSIYKFPSGMNTEQALKMALDCHASFLGWYWGPSSTKSGPLFQRESQTNETLEEYFQKRCGYRFVLSQASYPEKVQPGSSFELKQIWFQKGVARLYENYYYIKAYLQNENGIIELNTDKSFPCSQWLQGGPYDCNSTFTVGKDVPNGWYVLKIAVVDFTDKPAMNLAIAGKDQQNPNLYGRYPLGRIFVGKKPSGGKTKMPMLEDGLMSLVKEIKYSKDGCQLEGWTGMKIKVGDKPLYLKAIGRYFIKGNKGTHDICVISPGEKRIIAKSELNMSDLYKDEIGFKYAPAEAVLESGEEYYILCREQKGSDKASTGKGKIKYSNDFENICSVKSADLKEFETCEDRHTGLNLIYHYQPQDGLKSMLTKIGNSHKVDSNSPSAMKYFGMKITVGNRAITVNEIGRLRQDGESDFRYLSIVGLSVGSQVNLSLGKPDRLGIIYTGADIALDANKSYYLLSKEEPNSGFPAGSVFEVKSNDDFKIDGYVSSPDMKQFNETLIPNRASSVVNLRYEYAKGTSFVKQMNMLPEKYNQQTCWAGIKIKIGEKPIEIFKLGRYRLPTITENHLIRVVSEDGNILGATGLEIRCMADAMGFGYGTLGKPLRLEPGKVYYILSNEIANTDSWQKANVQTGDGIKIEAAVTTSDFKNYQPVEGCNNVGPVNLTFEIICK